MNIPAIRVFAPVPLPPITPGSIHAGIVERLPLLTALFCPTREEPAEVVLARLRVVAGDAGTVCVRWRPRMRYPIRVYRFGDEFDEQREMVLSAGDGGERVRRLADAIDGVGVFHGYDRDDMGWPTAMAVAATLAAVGGGFVLTSTGQWYTPNGLDLRPI